MISLAGALELCQDIEKTKDIPCEVVSIYQYDTCGLEVTKVFNSTPTLLFTKNFSVYGPSGRCNFTWNISDPGSYFWNVSNGDTGHILIEQEDNMISIIIAMGVYMLAFVGFGMMFKSLAMRFIGIGMAAIELMLMMFTLYAFESNVSITNLLRINFWICFFVIIAIGFVFIFIFISRLINPANDVEESDKPKW